MQKLLPLVILLASLASLASLCASTLSAQIIRVPGDAKTIQAGIDKARNGQTVQVAPGLYRERLDFKGKAITVVSRGGAVVTTIDGGGLGSVITFTSGETAASVLSGFTITNGTGTLDAFKTTYGGGIYCSLASPSLIGNIVAANRAHAGGGICLIGSKAVVVQNTVYKNSAEYEGAGITCRKNSPATIVANVIADNVEFPATKQLTGGGIHCDGSSPYIGHNTIRGNIGGYGGGGIYCGKSSPVIDRNTIHDNRVLGSQFAHLSNEAGGAGIYAENGSSPTITGNLIVNNICPYETYGGAISLWWAGPYEVTGNVIVGNRAAYGGGICLSHAGGSFTNNTVFGNRAQRGGGFVYRGYTGRPRVTNTVLWNNIATTAPEIQAEAGLTISDSVVEGGRKSTAGKFTWGNDMLAADPRFVDAAGFDFHLRYDSPCRDRGASSAPHLPAVDFEGDPRSWPTRPDIGADEFHPRVYATGRLGPGGAVTVKVLGPPAAWVTLGISANPQLRTPPLRIPGWGDLHLGPPAFALWLGTIPFTGLIARQFTIPAALPTPLVIPIQALLTGPGPGANTLTNPWRVEIR